MVTRAFLAAAAFALAIGPAAAQEKAGEGGAKPDLAKAQQTATQVCAACHGADGNSVSPVNPSLAGQSAAYIRLQLAHFKTGIRNNPVMMAMAAPLSDEDMRALGVYFEGQKPKGSATKNPDLVKSGSRLYRGGNLATGLPACASCHGPSGVGIPARYPRLGGQYAEYTAAQLKAFKAGERGMDKDGKDVNGRVMADIAGKLSERDMQALADYIAGLR